MRSAEEVAREWLESCQDVVQVETSRWTGVEGMGLRPNTIHSLAGLIERERRLACLVDDEGELEVMRTINGRAGR